MNEGVEKDVFERMVDRVLAYRPKKSAKHKKKHKAKRKKREKTESHD